MTLAERIAQLKATIADLRQQGRDEADGRLLRALAIGVRGHVFSVRDVFDRALLDPDVAAAVGDLSPKAIGKRLARCVDREIAGVTVRRVKTSNGSWLWVLDITPEAGASS